MVSPINYILDVKNPIEEAMRGYAFGRQDIEQRQVMQERDQMMGLRESQEARAAQEFEMRRAEAERQRAQAEAGQSALMRLMDLGPNATANDYSQAWLANPSIRQDLGALKTMMEAPKLKTTLDTSSRLYALARQGNADAVRDELSLQFEAAKNSGDQAMAATYGSALEQMNTNPEAALQSIAATSAFTIMGLQGPEYLSNVDKALGLDGGADGPPQVRSSTILDDGTVVTVTDAGPVVYARTGEVITGQAAADAVREAQEFGADVRRQREAGAATGRLTATAELGAEAAGATEAGKSGIQLSNATFEAIGPIQSNIANLNRAIELVEEEGANTGVLASRLPAWRASTIELRNLQNVLGLDVIGSVTFGALSENELRLALETALPTNLQEDALVDWLRRKRDAQEALVQNLQMRAEFTAIPGNTPGRWLQFTRSGGETFEDMYRWMSENPIRRSGTSTSDRPAPVEAPAERPEVTAERQFIADMQAKIDAGETLTPEEIARLNRIAGQ